MCPAPALIVDLCGLLSHHHVVLRPVSLGQAWAWAIELMVIVMRRSLLR